MSERTRINASDLQGLTRMITDASLNITDLVEDMHRTIVHPSFLPSTPIQHIITSIAGLSYASTRAGMNFFGRGLDKAFGLLHPFVGDGDGDTSEEKEFLMAILNGVLGDYLERTNNPLALPMQFRFQGRGISLDSTTLKKAYSNKNGKVLLMIHGLCMNDSKWKRNGHNHGKKLADELNLTTAYLNYNSGRHISTNGQNLNILLEELVENWPQPIEDLYIVAHSMGGLIGRSAIHYGIKGKKYWTKRLRKIIFLGTPHHGTPLERAGNFLDLLFESTPYIKPFTRLNKIRSAGITDLRYGNLVDEDWKGKDRFKRLKDKRTFIPLPQNVACYNIAATRGNENSNLSNRIVGDGLVPLESALGKHNKSGKTLSFKENHCYVAYEINHMDLLSNQDIYMQIKKWLSK